MGDSSIQCAISGLPIPARVDVLRIELTRNKNGLYPSALPVRGLMGSYGEIDDDDIVYKADKTYLHVYPGLWRAAGQIWLDNVRAHYGGWGNHLPSLISDIWDLREQQLEKREDPLTVIERPFSRANKTALRLFESLFDGILFFNPLRDIIGEWICQVTPPPKEDVQDLWELVLAFSAKDLTGRKMLEHGDPRCLEQYPTLEPESKWHQAILNQITVTQHFLNE